MVRADVHEDASGIAVELERLDVAVEVASLAVGDYAVGAKILVERKSVADLHETIAAGRFWRQVDRLRHAGAWPFRLVEGQRLDDGPIPAKAIRGVCVAAIARGIRLIMSELRADSAMWLYTLAARAGRTAMNDRPTYTQGRRPETTNDASEAVLAAVPSISTITARALLSHFGTVAAVVAASRSAWLEVPGIGPERARALDETLHHRPGAPTPPTTTSRGPRHGLST